MNRFILSLMFGMLVGGAIGLYLGWIPFPVEYLNNPASSLDQRYKDEYTIMVAAGYASDNDPIAAVERLRVLDVDNAPAYVQEVTERFITNSVDIDDILLLVTLSEGLGRLTPVMLPYREINQANTP